MAARPHPLAVAIAAGLLLLAGSVTAAVRSGEVEPGREVLVVAAEVPSPDPVAAGAPVSLVPSPPPSEVPTLTAPAGAPPAPQPPPVVPDLLAEELADLSVELSPQTAAPGNHVRVTVTLTNTSGRVLHVGINDDCGEALGSVSAPGLGFGSLSDNCSRDGGGPLAPGKSLTQTAYTWVEDGPARTVRVTATTAFALQPQERYAAAELFEELLTAAAPLDLLSTAEGTRTFEVLNDTASTVNVYCPCVPLVPYAAGTLAAGERAPFASSVFGVVRLYREGAYFKPVGCLDVAPIPEGAVGTVLRVSEARACGPDEG